MYSLCFLETVKDLLVMQNCEFRNARLYDCIREVNVRNDDDDDDDELSAGQSMLFGLE